MYAVTECVGMFVWDIAECLSVWFVCAVPECLWWYGLCMLLLNVLVCLCGILLNVCQYSLCVLLLNISAGMVCVCCC